MFRLSYSPKLSGQFIKPLLLYDSLSFSFHILLNFQGNYSGKIITKSFLVLRHFLVIVPKCQHMSTFFSVLSCAVWLCLVLIAFPLIHLIFKGFQTAHLFNFVCILYHTLCIYSVRLCPKYAIIC